MRKKTTSVNRIHILQTGQICLVILQRCPDGCMFSRSQSDRSRSENVQTRLQKNRNSRFGHLNCSEEEGLAILTTLFHEISRFHLVLKNPLGLLSEMRKESAALPGFEMKGGSASNTKSWPGPRTLAFNSRMLNSRGKACHNRLFHYKHWYKYGKREQ